MAQGPLSTVAASPSMGTSHRATTVKGRAMRTMELKSNFSRRRATLKKMTRATTSTPGEEWGPNSPV